MLQSFIVSVRARKGRTEVIAVIESGSKQYMVEKGHKITAELLHSDKEVVEFQPLLLIDGNNIHIGKPKLENAKVIAKITEPSLKGEKIRIQKYKPKKRQRTITGHRQAHTILEITDIKA